MKFESHFLPPDTGDLETDTESVFIKRIKGITCFFTAEHFCNTRYVSR